MRSVSREAVSDPFSVSGRTILIVGGTAGIGLAVARYLAGVGAEVIVTGRRRAEVEAEAARASYIAMDVTDPESVASGFAEVRRRWDRIDCLVLNAGVDRFHGEVDELDVEVVAQVIDVNTLGVVRAMAAGIDLVPDGGSVIVTSSPAGSVTTPGMAAYSASKAAIDMLVRTWALELGPRQVRVNAILPGIVESEMDSESTAELEVIRRMTATGVYRRAAEMGPIYQFLASPASTPLTGSLVGAHDGIPVGFSATVMEHLTADIEPSESGSSEGEGS